jgi:hypothetical protein
MRGCHLTLVPTTLLCMCDASLGGKTAIDYGGTKNLIGTFNPADEVLVCVDTLRTLSDHEFLNGLGEVIKHAFLSPDEELYKFLIVHHREIMQRDVPTLDQLVTLSLNVKNWYLEQDPLETKGIRSMLNLGHTFGHALESLSHFSGMSHGQAVAWGTCRAAEAALELHLGDETYLNGIIKLFRDYGFPVDYRIGRGDWIEYAEHLSPRQEKAGRRGAVHHPLSQGNLKLMPLEFRWSRTGHRKTVLIGFLQQFCVDPFRFPLSSSVFPAVSRSSTSCPSEKRVSSNASKKLRLDVKRNVLLFPSSEMNAKVLRSFLDLTKHIRLSSFSTSALLSSNVNVPVGGAS